MDRFKKEICCGIVALVVIVVVVIIMWPRSNLPDIEVHNVASEKARIVANLAGYMELLNNKSSNQILNIHTVSESIHTDGRVITLSGKNFQFDIGYTIHHEDVRGNVHDGIRYHFLSFDMLLRTDPDGTTFEGICAFDKPFDFFLPDFERYSCKQVITHHCSHQGDPVARLVLKSFELELNGDPDHVKRREFSKDGWPVSCNKWDS